MNPEERVIEIRIEYLPHHKGLPPLRRMTERASGFDIVAACEEKILIEPQKAVLIPAGFRFSIPHGYEAQVRPRSGLALKSRISLLNSPGTIDSDYRGEVGVILFNFGEDVFVVNRGDRIAQIVFARVPQVELVEINGLDETERGSGGFGSTG